MPVVSHRNALYMENEINGIHVEDSIIRRYEGADRARGEELGPGDLAGDGTGRRALGRRLLPDDSLGPGGG